MEKRNLELLRPFDLDAAKAGAAICYSHLMSTVEFVGEATAIGCIATKDEDGRIAITPCSQFRLAPLCWVEGKPVYKGDVLYYNSTAGVLVGDKRIAFGRRDDEPDSVTFSDVGSLWARTDSLTWTPPMLKRDGWVNVYPNNSVFMRSSKDDADNCATNERIACVRIEWEEPAGGAA